MRLVVQRTREASVSINNKVCGKIDYGLCLLLGVAREDTQEDAKWLARKALNLRIFSNSDGRMDLSLSDTGGGVLVISQFTLCAKTKKGYRPSFTPSADPYKAEQLYDYFIDHLKQESDDGTVIATGKFGADMQVSLVNDGPVTIWLDTQNKE